MVVGSWLIGDGGSVQRELTPNMILGSRSTLSAKTDCIGTDHLWRNRPFSTLSCIILYPAGLHIYRPS